MSDLPVAYLVRHGETEWSRSGRHTGLTDVPLTERGELDARRIGERLRILELVRVWSSPLQRAARTCELAGFAATARIDPDLVEWNYGDYEGRRTAEILQERPSWRLFDDGCPGGESPDDVGARADRVIDRIRAAAGNVLVFSSAHFLRVVGARWLGLAPAGGRYFVLATASLSALGYEHDLGEPVFRFWDDTGPSGCRMKVLVIDVGGTHVKILATGQKLERRMESGPHLTARQMVSGVRALAKGWKYDAVSIGYPGPVLRDRPLNEPYNLGKGWVKLDYDAALGCPVKMVNDAAMQALGSYEGGRMLFLGLGTGLGSTLVVDGVIVPMELAHLPYRKATFDNYVGKRGLDRYGRKKWRRYVEDVVGRLIAAFEPDDVVLGGGNATNLAELPPRCRLGSNANAFAGGFRLWAAASKRRAAHGNAPRSSPPRGR